MQKKFPWWSCFSSLIFQEKLTIATWSVIKIRLRFLYPEISLFLTISHSHLSRLEQLSFWVDYPIPFPSFLLLRFELSFSLLSQTLLIMSFVDAAKFRNATHMINALVADGDTSITDIIRNVSFFILNKFSKSHMKDLLNYKKNYIINKYLHFSNFRIFSYRRWNRTIIFNYVHDVTREFSN